MAEADLEYRVYDSLDELLDALKTGDIDFAVGLNKTAQRKKHFLFSTPFMEAPRGIVANQSIANDALKNLASLRWVCITGSSHCEYLVENGALFINRFIKPDDAFKKVADGLKVCNQPDEAVFYTSGRTSNEAAFLYQLFVRQFGTNNLPDCSNMCHESSGAALNQTIGIGKGTVTLEDIETTDCLMVIGQNPGTNHPRMLTSMEEEVWNQEQQ